MGCAADTYDEGIVSGAELGSLLLNWGPSPN
jgi:hypothetical protein